MEIMIDDYYELGFLVSCFVFFALVFNTVFEDNVFLRHKKNMAK